jgi:3-oxoacyl-[acyl-carrier protein] reductase/meso-butanediol dehydrogenase/(S,S)-butanediol dehydrogenase/diacetyl reductase
MPTVLTGIADKVAIVTGAGRMRGIGRWIAVEMARAGCDVVITGTGRSPDRYPDDEKAAGWRDIESVADEVRALGRRALPIVASVTDEADIERLMGATLSELGRADFLVNNAASSRGNDRVPVVEMATEEWDRVIGVNLRGTFLMSRAFARHLLAEQKPGCIINISSVAGKSLPARATAYGASKAGIQALSAGMAVELGPSGIRVNTICPGFVDTSRMDVPGRAREERLEAAAERSPLRAVRVGDEIGTMAAFLCSDQGNWVTGQAINVNGGSFVAH